MGEGGSEEDQTVIISAETDPKIHVRWFIWM